MLEAHAHNQLKHLLQGESFPWPHNLTLSRLVARSLRRGDNSLIQLDIGSHDFWWIGLLVPLCLKPSNAVLVLSKKQRNHLFNVELQILKQKGFQLACWEGLDPPSEGQLWVIDHGHLINALHHGYLHSRHLIIPEAEFLTERLRDAMSLRISLQDWENLRRAHPSADAALLQLYERLSRRLFSFSTRINAQVRIDCSELVALRDLVGCLSSSPSPWPELLSYESQNWASWAELNHKTLNWMWLLKPLEPLAKLKSLFKEQPLLLLAGRGSNLLSQLESIDCPLDVTVAFGDTILKEPLSIFAPRLQPLPNSEFFSQHLLEQSRRLILGLQGVTIVLLDDDYLRRQLTSELAAEFGKRVMHEETCPESNGVVCCRWSWWLAYQDQLPVPSQLIVGLLPLGSLEDPLIAARVEAYKRQGRDWFRDLLLPEALTKFPKAVSSLRGNGGRMAILDGRLRSRSWGEQIYKALEPWTRLQHLLPH